MRNNEPISVRDFSRGMIRTVQNSICPANSYKNGINLDSTDEIGSLVSRKGTTVVGTQAVEGATCCGLHYHHDPVATNHKLFGVFSDGANNDIYDMGDGTKSLEDDTKDLKTRFCTFLNSTVRVNGTDAAKSYNGSSWVTTGGAFDEDNMPLGNVVIEWKDRVYTAGVSSAPAILYYSSVADPDAKTVSWDTDDDAGQIEIEQEDGGGAITALEKVPGYLLIFKERSMKRWDGESTYPDDLIGIGAPTQEAVCRGREMVFFANQEGVWATNGGYPKLISKPIQDLWDAIPAANLTSIATFCDEKDIYIYVGDITLGQNTYSNVCFKFNIDSQSWNIYSYADDFTVFTWYISSSKKVMLGGDKNGQCQQINEGTTDNGEAINYSLETQDLELGAGGRYKEVNKIVAFTRNTRKGQLHYRANSDSDKDWKSFGNITNDVEDREFKGKGNWFNFKISGTTNTGQVKILGFMFPEKSINIVENTKE